MALPLSTYSLFERLRQKDVTQNLAKHLGWRFLRKLFTGLGC